jgi:hypothetical protein
MVTSSFRPCSCGSHITLRKMGEYKNSRTKRLPHTRICGSVAATPKPAPFETETSTSYEQRRCRALLIRDFHLTRASLKFLAEYYPPSRTFSRLRHAAVGSDLFVGSGVSVGGEAWECRELFERSAVSGGYTTISLDHRARLLESETKIRSYFLSK